MQVSSPSVREPHSRFNPGPHGAIPAGDAARYLGMARSIGIRFGHDRATREDLTSEAVLALVECASRFEPGRGHQLISFAWPAMRGRAVDAIRREVSHVRRVQQQTAAAPRSPSVPLGAQLDVHDVLSRAGSRLNANQRLVLHERYWAGRTLAEVARHLGWSESKTRHIHQVAVQRLRKVVGRNQGPWREPKDGPAPVRPPKSTTTTSREAIAEL